MMNEFKDESGYLTMLAETLGHGKFRKPDGEEGRFELFGGELSFDMSEWKLPLLTTKYMNFKSLAVEMLWFLSGSQTVHFLHKNNVHIWDTWANDGTGIIGPLYGFMMRHWPIDASVAKFHPGKTHIDQMTSVMESLRNRPEARSHMVIMYRPDFLPAQSIKPCHYALQFYRYDNEISLKVTQRSCDIFLGVPFNIAQYGLLLAMVCHQLDCVPKTLIWSGGDIHIYENHVEQARKQLLNEIKPPPKILFLGAKPKDLFNYTYDHFLIQNYMPGPRIKGAISAQGKPKQGVLL